MAVEQEEHLVLVLLVDWADLGDFRIVLLAVAEEAAALIFGFQHRLWVQMQHSGLLVAVLCSLQ